MGWSEEYRKYLELKRWEEDNGVVKYYVRQELPRHDYYTCHACNGSGQFYSNGDLHRSAGWEPCTVCSSGTVTYKIVTKYRAKARRREV